MVEGVEADDVSVAHANEQLARRAHGAEDLTCRKGYVHEEGDAQRGDVSLADHRGEED